MIDRIFFRYYDSPFGRLKLGTFDGRLCLCCWCGTQAASAVEKMVSQRLKATLAVGKTHVSDNAAEALDAYFNGNSHILDIPLLLPGSDFQRRIWFGLSYIEYGSTVSYGDICRIVTGKTAATRAVASAVGDNPVCLFIPCHRVVGRNGRLTGYAGGLLAKEGLLAMEKGMSGLFRDNLL